MTRWTLTRTYLGVLSELQITVHAERQKLNRYKGRFLDFPRPPKILHILYKTWRKSSRHLHLLRRCGRRPIREPHHAPRPACKPPPPPLPPPLPRQKRREHHSSIHSLHQHLLSPFFLSDSSVKTVSFSPFKNAFLTCLRDLCRPVEFLSNINWFASPFSSCERQLKLKKKKGKKALLCFDDRCRSEMISPFPFFKAATG